MRRAIAILVLVGVAGCAGSPIWSSSPLRVQIAAERNRDNLLKIEPGLDKAKVLEVMGKPYKTEAYTVGGKPYEFWLYITDGIGDFGKLSDANFTPLAFQNGVLKGWGRNYFDTAVRVRKELTVRSE